MARGTTLEEAIRKLRAELRQTTSSTQGLNTLDNHRQLLQRTQERLADEFAWPFLRVKYSVPVSAGQRYYDIPANMPFEKIEKVELKWGREWRVLCSGIHSGLYNHLDPDEDHRQDPVRHWDLFNEGAANQDQIEVWPLPASNGYLYDANDRTLPYEPARSLTGDGILRFTGTRDLQPLVKDSDRLDLDDNMVVLYAAAELLAGSSKTNAEGVAKAAARRFSQLTKRNQKSGLVKFNTGSRRQRGRRGTITVVSNATVD